MDLAERLPSQMADQDAAADLARLFAEDGMVRLWSSFQRFAEAMYAAQPASATFEIAIARRATLVTRNNRHFGDLPVPVVNPWAD